MSAWNYKFQEQATTTKQKQSTAVNKYDNGGQDCPNIPEMQNLSGNNTATDTEDDKNNKATNKPA